MEIPGRNLYPICHLLVCLLFRHDGNHFWFCFSGGHHPVQRVCEPVFHSRTVGRNVGAAVGSIGGPGFHQPVRGTDRESSATLEKLAAGEIPEEVHFRSDDLLQDFDEDFNVIRARLQSVPAESEVPENEEVAV